MHSSCAEKAILSLLGISGSKTDFQEFRNKKKEFQKFLGISLVQFFAASKSSINP
jgi:hypothetical protein